MHSRLYSCLASGNSDEFTKGEHLFKNKSVKDALQIGFYLSATINPLNSGKPAQQTSVTFDRKKIISTQCTCSQSAEWCSHVVALCLQRIHLVRFLKPHTFFSTVHDAILNFSTKTSA